MPLTRVYKEDKKQPEKKTVKDKPTKKEKEQSKVEEKKQEQPKVEPVQETPVTVEKVKRASAGVGITGQQTEINLFRATCKFKKLDIGEELLKMIQEWNKVNKIG